MIVRGNGNVGIGTVNPANKLHVAGSITVDGNINAKYQDVAEGFAMKSVPVEIGGVQIHRPGTLIGKALEPLLSGQGDILCLLRL
ncbi:MAG TPA: hypothetical protein VJM12_12025 [Pyrinomonadaceae bacterium]|nr:hypothetical protein [Pyrinomonadaceae bacterium]